MHRLSAAEVDQRLAIELPKVKFRKVPLAQFVDFIGELAALPIAIDDEGLARAGHKRSVAVTVELSDTTARDALRGSQAVGPDLHRARRSVDRDQSRKVARPRGVDQPVLRYIFLPSASATLRHSAIVSSNCSKFSDW